MASTLPTDPDYVARGARARFVASAKGRAYTAKGAGRSFKARFLKKSRKRAT
jgi:hypothetical protein